VLTRAFLITTIIHAVQKNTWDRPSVTACHRNPDFATRQVHKHSKQDRCHRSVKFGYIVKMAPSQTQPKPATEIAPCNRYRSRSPRRPTIPVTRLTKGQENADSAHELFFEEYGSDPGTLVGAAAWRITQTSRPPTATEGDSPGQGNARPRRSSSSVGSRTSRISRSKYSVRPARG